MYIADIQSSGPDSRFGGTANASGVRDGGDARGSASRGPMSKRFDGRDTPSQAQSASPAVRLLIPRLHCSLGIETRRMFCSL